MKLRKFKKDDEGSLYKNEKQSGAVSGWAETDPSQFNRLAKEAKTEGRRAPEFWVKDGESRTVRFVDDAPIASFKVYSFKHKGKWRTFVKPGPNDADLFESTLEKKASTVFLYRVIDIQGYTDKKGKQIRNQAKFLAAKTRMYEQINMVRSENSENGELNEYDIKISRSGTATNTTYQFFPKPPTPFSPEMKKAISTFPKWEEYYRPLSRSQQQAIVAGYVDEVESED